MYTVCTYKCTVLANPAAILCIVPLQECRRAGFNFIAPEHIMLAILATHDCEARRLLEGYGLPVDLCSLYNIFYICFCCPSCCPFFAGHGHQGTKPVWC
jgi:hypothetical protein